MEFRSIVFGLLAGTLAMSAMAGNRPPGYKTICTENRQKASSRYSESRMARRCATSSSG